MKFCLLHAFIFVATLSACSRPTWVGATDAGSGGTGNTEIAMGNEGGNAPRGSGGEAGFAEPDAPNGGQGDAGLGNGPGRGSGGSSGSADGAGNSTGASGAAVGSVTIGPSGGSVVSEDAQAVLTVPAGALDRDVVVTISLATKVPQGTFGAAYEIEPTGTVFNAPALLELHYDAGRLGDVDPARLVVATVEDGAWKPLALSGRASDENELVAPLEHLSPYALVERGQSSDPCECDTGCFRQGCELQFGTVDVATTETCTCTGRANADPYAFYWSLDDFYGACAKKPYGNQQCTPCRKACMRTHQGYVNLADDEVCLGNWTYADAMFAGIKCMAACTDEANTCGGGEQDDMASHFHVDLDDDVDQTIDCTELDVDATDETTGLVGYGYFDLGGESQSTGQTFKVKAPLSASRLRDPSLLKRYPMASWGTSRWFASNTAENLFELSLRLVDESGKRWSSCAPGDCGLEPTDTTYFGSIASITEVSTDAGSASFRVAGWYAALVTDSTTTKRATGDWSILVSVPDPGPLDCTDGCAGTDASCAAGTADAACGSNGAACVDCTASSQTCLAQHCVACSPGTVREQGCNGLCGKQTATCGDDGAFGPFGACSSGPTCDGACCDVGETCMKCPGATPMQCLASGESCQ